VILIAFYALIPFVEVIAPYNPAKRHGDFLYAPPQWQTRCQSVSIRPQKA
jgi:ABC-type antimicrobial peptide transport system permease subunit